VSLASVLFGVVGAGCLGTLTALDTARIPHGTDADVALVLGWLTGGALALMLGLVRRFEPLGPAGLALGVLALPLGLVAFGIFALTQTT
jgi:hypothetical protein